MEAQGKTRIHPLMAGAAVAVIIAAGVAVAAVTGHLPGSNAQPSNEKALVKTEQHKTAPKQHVASAKIEHPKAKTVCIDCGTVVDVQEVDVKGHGTGAGAVAGGVAGAVIGHQIGDGSRTGRVVGAVGGAVVGHQIEREVRSTKRFDISVRMEDGSVKTVSSEKQPAWRSGDKVRIHEGQVLPL